MLAGVQRFSQIHSLARNCHQMREDCLDSLRNFPTAIANNEFNATANALEDGSVEVWILGETVRLSVDFMIQNGEVAGKILCEKVNYEGKRSPLFQHCVEWGQVFADKVGGNLIDNLESKSYSGKLLFKICEAIITEHTVGDQNA